MSFTCRIADVALTVSEPEFGGSLDSPRAVSLAALLSGTSADDVAAQISHLNSRLSEACDLVLLPSGASGLQSLRLTGGGLARVENLAPMQLQNWAKVQITAPCDPYARPANRVFLGSPFGDEWPPATATDIARTDANHVYADGGRWCVRADASANGILYMRGDAVPDEVLVIEFDWEFTAGAAYAFVVGVELLAADGGAVLDAWNLKVAAAAGSGHVREYVRVRSDAYRFNLRASAAYASSTAAEAYIWNVEVGRKKSASHRLAPGGASDHASAAAGIPYGWVSQTIDGVAWATSGNLMTVSASPNAADTAFCSSVLDGYFAGALPVVAGRTIGTRFYSQVTSYTDGVFKVGIRFTDAAGAVVSTTDIRTVTAADGAGVWTNWTGTVPAGAAFASLYWGPYGAGTTGDMSFGNAELGEHVVEAPDAVSLMAIAGEHPASLEVYGDVDPESDAHSVYVGVGECDGPYIWEAEALTWTGTSDAYATDAAFHPGTGNTGWKNSAANECSASIDTSRVKPGAYLLLVRGMSNSPSYAATFKCDESSTGSTGVSTTVATPVWLSLGQVVLPPRRTHVGTSANITVRLNSVTSGEAKADRYLLIPLTQGGYAAYHDSTATDGVSQFDVLADGTILLDSAVDLSDCYGGSLAATARDRLVVCAEKAASDETTHLVILGLLHTPLYDLWRGGA